MAHRLYSILAQSNASALAQQGSRISGWVWVIIFILVTLIVWWLLTRSTSEESGIHVEHNEHHEGEHEIESIEIAEKSAPLAIETTAVGPDDLTLLEGIGPKVNGVLQAAGISTYVQLATADPNQLKQLLESAGYAYMDPASWPQQAKLLAEGRMEEFEALTASLKGGRKAS